MNLKTTLLPIALFLTMTVFSQSMSADLDETSYDYHVTEKAKLNFFIVSQRKKGSLDLASRFNVFRAKMKSFFRPKKFVAIVAEDAGQASRKIEYRLLKYDASIGTIWFDSHGMYKKGYSLFFIGKDEYSYLTLKDSCMMAPMQKLSAYTTGETKLVIGSCYGGATYQRTSIDYKDTTRMNGDSLMIALGKIFKQGNVYASESWVMTRPGLFLKRPAVAGFPGRKLFLDLCYQPAWENVGKWNGYNAATETFTKINPITLDMYGNAIIRSMAYTDKESVKKDIEKNLGKLQPGLYK
jgi:hypothetical protein